MFPIHEIDTAKADRDTRFEYDEARGTLRAIAVVDRTDGVLDRTDARARAGDEIATLARRLNDATTGSLAHLRGGGRFELDATRSELVLAREFDLATLDFAALLISLRRLDRTAGHWKLMRPAHLGEAVGRLRGFVTERQAS